MIMMDDNTDTPSTSPQDQISLLFAAAAAAAAQDTQTQQQLQMHHHHHHHPFSSSSSSYYHYPLERGSGGEDSGAGTGSEEGLGVPEEDPARPAPHRSGSKRSRAAEVHNLSEKRRRSRINEKIKALQNLIPNSNKTDKASMLDEAIEYLQQLQLQVQMLSMRNGLNSNPMYLPGALHPLQASQLCMSFGDNAPAMNLGVLGMLPLNQDSSANNSFDLTSQCTTSHQTVMLPTTSISAPETSFGLETSQSHHASFQFRVPSEEMFTHDMVAQQLDSGRTTGDLSENVMKTMDVPTTLHFGGQASSSSLEQNDHLENVLSKDNPDKNPIFDQNFDGLQTGRSFSKDVKSEALGI